MSMLIEEIQELVDDQKILKDVCNELKTTRKQVLDKARTLYKEMPKSAFERLNQLIDDCKEDIDSLRYECEDQGCRITDAISELESLDCSLEYNVDDVSAKLDTIQEAIREEEEVTEAVDMTKVMIETQNQAQEILADAEKKMMEDYDNIGKETTNE